MSESTITPTTLKMLYNELEWGELQLIADQTGIQRDTVYRRFHKPDMIDDKTRAIVHAARIVIEKRKEMEQKIKKFKV